MSVRLARELAIGRVVRLLAHVTSVLLGVHARVDLSVVKVGRDSVRGGHPGGEGRHSVRVVASPVADRVGRWQVRDRVLREQEPVRLPRVRPVRKVGCRVADLCELVRVEVVSDVDRRASLERLGAKERVRRQLGRGRLRRRLSGKCAG